MRNACFDRVSSHFSFAGPGSWLDLSWLYVKKHHLEVQAHKNQQFAPCSKASPAIAKEAKALKQSRRVAGSTAARPQRKTGKMKDDEACAIYRLHCMEVSELGDFGSCRFCPGPCHDGLQAVHCLHRWCLQDCPEEFLLGPASIPPTSTHVSSWERTAGGKRNGRLSGFFQSTRFALRTLHIQNVVTSSQAIILQSLVQLFVMHWSSEPKSRRRRPPCFRDRAWQPLVRVHCMKGRFHKVWRVLLPKRRSFGCWSFLGP